MPSADLREWLEAERRVEKNFLNAAGGDAKRARWAVGRAKRIEAELRRRSGRNPLADP